MTESQIVFLETKEYKRFAEFCDACRRYKYIGLCYGSPGVGKSESAKHYAKWPLIEEYDFTNVAKPEVVSCRTVYHIASVISNPKKLFSSIRHGRITLSWAVEDSLGLCEPFIDETSGMPDFRSDHPDVTELIIVDEADRMKTLDLEQLRDMYDRNSTGVILIGMPGLEKKISRYPQLYSRVGFVHHFRPLSNEEMQFILQHKWKQLGIALKLDDFTDMEAVAEVTRITGGNFRLVNRLFMQIERLMRINELSTISKEVVEAAREHLIIGGV